MSDLAVFNDDAARRIAEATRSYERRITSLENKLAQIATRRHEANWKPARIYICKASEPIPAMEGSVPGSGEVVVFRLIDGTLEVTPIRLTVHNLADVEVAANVWLQVVEDVLSCKFWVNYEVCPDAE